MLINLMERVAHISMVFVSLPTEDRDVTVGMVTAVRCRVVPFTRKGSRHTGVTSKVFCNMTLML